MSRYVCKHDDCEKGPATTGDALTRTSPKGQDFEGLCTEHYPGQVAPIVTIIEDRNRHVEILRAAVEEELRRRRPRA